MTKNTSGLKRRPPHFFEIVGERLRASREKKSARNKWIIAAALAASIAIPLEIHDRRQALETAQGEAEAGLAQSIVSGVLGAWTPSAGFGRLASRPPQWEAPWGAAATLRAGADGSSIAVEYAFASQSQCLGLIQASQAFFERAAVDGAAGGSPEERCARTGQNAIVLIKANTKAAALSVDAGAASAIAGGWIPQQALPATPEQLRLAKPPQAPSSLGHVAKPQRP